MAESVPHDSRTVLVSKYILLDIALSLFQECYSISNKTKGHNPEPDDLDYNTSSASTQFDHLSSDLSRFNSPKQISRQGFWLQQVYLGGDPRKWLRKWEGETGKERKQI